MREDREAAEVAVDAGSRAEFVAPEGGELVFPSGQAPAVPEVTVHEDADAFAGDVGPTGQGADVAAEAQSALHAPEALAVPTFQPPISLIVRTLSGYRGRTRTKLWQEKHAVPLTAAAKGKKLYAVLDKTGKFKDIQTYKRAHGSDIKRKRSRSEFVVLTAGTSQRVLIRY